MADQTEIAYVLKEDFEPASSEPQVFVGFPGLYLKDEPVALATLGLTEDDADARIELDDLPLEKVEVAAEDHDFAFNGGMVSGAELRSKGLPPTDYDRSPMAGLSSGEFEDLVAEETEKGEYSPVVEAAMQAGGIKPPEIERKWPSKHDGMNALAREHNVTFSKPGDELTVAEKRAELEAAGVDAPIAGAGS